MNKLIQILSISIAMLLAACSNSDLYDDMPREIQVFISQYYPNRQLASFTSTDTSFTVEIKEGPTIVFDSKYKWTSINGNGAPLPQVLMFNDLPPKLYSYLEETEDTKDVYRAQRNTATYMLTLHDYTLYYDISTGEITGKDESQAS